MKLLIIGDSFAASDNAQSWVNLLDHEVTNLSSCGSSQYRILKKLIEVRISDFDHVLLVHTSPYRIYIENNPLHFHTASHRHCDLIYSDVQAYRGVEFADHAIWWFENAVDLPQCELVHKLLVSHSEQLLQNTARTHISFFDGCNLPFVHNFSPFYHDHPGSINHMNDIGNLLVSQKLREII